MSWLSLIYPQYSFVQCWQYPEWMTVIGAKTIVAAKLLYLWSCIHFKAPLVFRIQMAFIHAFFLCAYSLFIIYWISYDIISVNIKINSGEWALDQTFNVFRLCCETCTPAYWGQYSSNVYPAALSGDNISHDYILRRNSISQKCGTLLKGVEK